MANDQAHGQSSVAKCLFHEAARSQTFHPTKGDNILTSQHPRILANSIKVLPSTSGCCTSSLREPDQRVIEVFAA
jgi:hypothetical protein